MPSRLRPLSARAVASLDRTAFVGGVSGLQLVVSSGGGRSWRLFYRLPGDAKRRAMKLGSFPALTLADARKRAEKCLCAAADGSDPKQVLTATVVKRALTVDQAVTRYLTWCETQNRAVTVRDKRSMLINHLVAAVGQWPLVDVKRVDIVKILDRLIDRAPARRSVHAYLRHFFGWARERDLINTDPTDGLKPPKTNPARERILSDTEVRALWRATGTMAVLSRLALLTAQRKGSLESMTWANIDFDQRRWAIPAEDMKSGRAHVVPLSDRACAVLQAWPRLAGPFVFGVGTNGAKPYDGSSNGMMGLRKQLGDPDWRFHDLRRTAVTLAQRGGASIESIRALTQHKVPGVIGVYARHDYDVEKQQVADVIQKRIDDVLRGDSSKYDT